MGCFWVIAQGMDRRVGHLRVIEALVIIREQDLLELFR